MNRAVAHLPLFQEEGDYDAFERVLAEALDEHPIRSLAYCVMPNHWHFVLWPDHDGQVNAFLRWLTHTHTQRWHAHHHTAGTGHIYQGRFKAFPVQEDEHLLAVLRYVERNPVRAHLVPRAEAWRWSSLGHRHAGDQPARAFLSPGPVPLPADWLTHVNTPQTEAELVAVRRSVVRERPFGSEGWLRQTAGALGLGYTLRERGRPKKVCQDEG